MSGKRLARVPCPRLVASSPPAVSLHPSAERSLLVEGPARWGAPCAQEVCHAMSGKRPARVPCPRGPGPRPGWLRKGGAAGGDGERNQRCYCPATGSTPPRTPAIEASLPEGCPACVWPQAARCTSLWNRSSGHVYAPWSGTGTPVAACNSPRLGRLRSPPSNRPVSTQLCPSLAVQWLWQPVPRAAAGRPCHHRLSMVRAL